MNDVIGLGYRALMSSVSLEVCVGERCCNHASVRGSGHKIGNFFAPALPHGSG